MADEAINPEVKTSIADISGVRVQQGYEENMPRNFWSTLKKGHYRYALGGAAFSVPVTATLGILFCAAVGLSGGLALAAVATFVAAGGLMLAEGFGTTGAAATSRAAGLAEKHARILDADAQGKGILAATDDKLMVNGRGHHYEEPIGRDKGKIFSLKGALAGVTLGAIGGAVVGLGASVAAIAGHLTGLAAIGTVMAESPILGTIATGLAAVVPLAAPAIALAVAGAATFALFGLTFGIDRSVIKSMFNETDSIIQGKVSFKNGPDLGRLQSQESEYALTQHRIRRQEEMDALEKAYNDRIFAGALAGRFRGFAAVVPGAAVGAALGAVALAGIALAAGTAAIASAAIIVPLFAAIGGMYSMKVMSESGTEAGAEATARAIDNEFERNRALRARGITPPAPKEVKQGWFSAKTAIICAVVGAAVGIALAPIVGVATLAAVTGVAASSIGAFSVPAIATSAFIGAGVAATYGLGGKYFKAMTQAPMKLYDAATGHGHAHSPELAKSPCVAQQMASQPVCETITADDMARITQKTISGNNGKTFVQSVTEQQMQPQSYAVGV